MYNINIYFEVSQYFAAVTTIKVNEFVVFCLKRSIDQYTFQPMIYIQGVRNSAIRCRK